MSIFKKKSKLNIKTETTTGVGKVGPVPEPVVPKLKPACGFEYNGQIYKTADEANCAYQKDQIKKHRMPVTYWTPGSEAWIASAVEHWDVLRKIALMKLEVE